MHLANLITFSMAQKDHTKWLYLKHYLKFLRQRNMSIIWFSNKERSP